MNKNIIIGIVALVVIVGGIVVGAFLLFPVADSSMLGTASTTTTGTTGTQAGTPAGFTNTGLATIDPASFTVATTSPLIQGSAKNDTKVMVIIADGEEVVWQSQVPVKDQAWGVLGTLPKNVAPGTKFKILVRADGEPNGTLLAEGSLVFQP